MTLPLSKTLDPADVDQLGEELAIVDRHFTTAREQHPMRRWEYAMALRAQQTWDEHGFHHAYPQGPIFDVGGAGSPFWKMIDSDRCWIIDPAEGDDLEDYLRGVEPRLGAEVYCLSVLEHVEDLDQFMYHLACLVAPGGLLFLTMDACGCPSHAADVEVGDPPDQHHFHWMRRRMFGQADRRWVAERLLHREFQWLGAREDAYHGDHVYDYSFASLALIKRS